MCEQVAACWTETPLFPAVNISFNLITTHGIIPITGKQSFINDLIFFSAIPLPNHIQKYKIGNKYIATVVVKF